MRDRRHRLRRDRGLVTAARPDSRVGKIVRESPLDMPADLVSMATEK